MNYCKCVRLPVKTSRYYAQKTKTIAFHDSEFPFKHSSYGLNDLTVVHYIVCFQKGLRKDKH